MSVQQQKVTRSEMLAMVRAVLRSHSDESTGLSIKDVVVYDSPDGANWNAFIDVPDGKKLSTRECQRRIYDDIGSLRRRYQVKSAAPSR